MNRKVCALLLTLTSLVTAEYTGDLGFIEYVEAGMVVSLGKEFIKSKHVWAMTTVVEKFCSFAAEHDLPLMAGITMKNFKFNNVADTFGQAESLTYLDEKAVGGRFWNIGSVIMEFDYEAHK